MGVDLFLEEKGGIPKADVLEIAVNGILTINSEAEFVLSLVELGTDIDGAFTESFIWVVEVDKLDVVNEKPPDFGGVPGISNRSDLIAEIFGDVHDTFDEIRLATGEII